MLSMPNLKIVLALLLIMLLSLPPAEASVKDKVKTAASKSWHLTKKVAVLPLYVAGGTGAALIIWWHFAPDELGVANHFIRNK